MRLEKSFCQAEAGFILIDKPAGPTSHDVVDRLRAISGVLKIGHAGTLDPFASGLLPLAVGRPATRQLGRLLQSDKVYRAVARLGQETDTGDRTGQVTARSNQRPRSKEIETVLSAFRGKSVQTVPAHSAKKIHGRKLYELARRGHDIKRPRQEIEIYRLEVLDYRYPELVFLVHCSKGAYIRTLAADIGRRLGCKAHLARLRRLRIGRLSIKEAVPLDRLTAANWQQYLKEKIDLN